MTDAPTHRRGPAVTQHILSCALELVTEHRSMNLSIDDIASRAGVNKTTLYRRWTDVHALLHDAVASHAETAVPLDPTGDVRADLVRLCTDVVANLESPIGRALVASRDITPELEAMRAAFWDARFAAAAELLGEAASPGASDLVLERLVGPLHFRVLERGLPVESEAIKEHVDHFLRGVGHSDLLEP